MKDGRNLINLIAAVNVLAIISDYQKWGQLEKASAFERKFAVARLKQKLKCLKETHKAKKIINDHFNFIDFVAKKVTVGNLHVEIGWLPNSKTALIKKVSDLSDVFDLRL